MGHDGMSHPVGIEFTRDLEGHSRVTGVYGKEVLLDCYYCDPETFNRESLEKYFNQLIEILGMQKGDLYFWDDVGVPEEERQIKPETKGTTAIQFILTSNITVHCLDLLERVYVNIFSCKDFAEGIVKNFTQEWFKSKSISLHVIYRP